MTRAFHMIRMRIPQDKVLDYLTGKGVVVNIPEGSRLVRLALDVDLCAETIPLSNILVITIEHESFRAVEEGGRLPVVEVQYRRTR